eukprot:scaffold1434_cov107-Cylindrotheca_fusiformis.AAC.8
MRERCNKKVKEEKDAFVANEDLTRAISRETETSVRGKVERCQQTFVVVVITWLYGYQNKRVVMEEGRRMNKKAFLEVYGTILMQQRQLEQQKAD